MPKVGVDPNHRINRIESIEPIKASPSNLFNQSSQINRIHKIDRLESNKKQSCGYQRLFSNFVAHQHADSLTCQHFYSQFSDASTLPFFNGWRVNTLNPPSHLDERVEHPACLPTLFSSLLPFLSSPFLLFFLSSESPIPQGGGWPPPLAPSWPPACQTFWTLSLLGTYFCDTNLLHGFVIAFWRRFKPKAPEMHPKMSHHASRKRYQN